MAVVTFQCRNPTNSQTLKWASFSYLTNKEYLINHRTVHWLVCSGMLPTHYIHFCSGADIGDLSKEKKGRKLKMAIIPMSPGPFKTRLSKHFKKKLVPMKNLMALRLWLMPDIVGVKMQRTVLLLGSGRRPIKFYNAVISSNGWHSFTKTWTERYWKDLRVFQWERCVC